METQVIIFRKGDVLAHVVTDGKHHAVYTSTGRTLYDKLHQAIAALEADGYSILNQ